MAKRSKRKSNYRRGNYNNNPPRNNTNVSKEPVNEQENEMEIKKRMQESLDVLLYGNEKSIPETPKEDFDFSFENESKSFGVHVSIDQNIPYFKVFDLEKILHLSYSGKEQYIDKDSVYDMIHLSKSNVVPQFKEWFDELVRYLLGETAPKEEESVSPPEEVVEDIPEYDEEFILFEIGDKVYHVPRNIPSSEIRHNITLQALKWAWEQKNDNSNIHELQDKVEKQDNYINEMKRQINEFANQQSKLLQELQS